MDIYCSQIDVEYFEKDKNVLEIQSKLEQIAYAKNNTKGRKSKIKHNK